MKQHGFTLIELIVVIVILGILAAVALPRFIDLREEAGEAAASGVAGAVASASAINFSARLVNSAKLGTTVINDCDEAPLESILTGWVAHWLRDHTGGRKLYQRWRCDQLHGYRSGWTERNGLGALLAVTAIPLRGTVAPDRRLAIGRRDFEGHGVRLLEGHDLNGTGLHTVRHNAIP